MNASSVGHACRSTGIAVLVLAAAACSSIFGTSGPPRMCLDIQASANLNQFEEQPHVVVLYFFALQTPTGFMSADLRRLVNGERPPGMIGERWETTVLPGQHLEQEDQLPRDTPYVGVVADFYRGPDRVLLEPSCGIFGGDRIVLSSSDIQTN